MYGSCICDTLSFTALNAARNGWLYGRAFRKKLLAMVLDLDSIATDQLFYHSMPAR